MFKTPQTDAMMASAITEHASQHGVKTIAYIGQADALGETFYAEVAKFAQIHKINVVANERFNRTDPSVTGQILKIMAANPDAARLFAAHHNLALKHVIADKLEADAVFDEMRVVWVAHVPPPRRR